MVWRPTQCVLLDLGVFGVIDGREYVVLFPEIRGNEKQGSGSTNHDLLDSLEFIYRDTELV